MNIIKKSFLLDISKNIELLFLISGQSTSEILFNKKGSTTILMDRVGVLREKIELHF